jgi:N-acetylglucosamine kinase-like BadF-type ATPase
MRYFLGGDLGGSKSHLLIADETGRAVGFAVGTGANHETVGYAVVTGVVRAMLGVALDGAGLEASAIVGAGMGISGYDWQSERSDQLAALALAGIEGFPVEVVNDAVVGLLAGSNEGWGIGLVSGTGCNCWGIDRHQRHGRVLGRGARVGEFAGGKALVQRAVWAVAREATRRGPGTALTPALVSYTGTRDADDFLEAFCEGRVHVPASAAPLVFGVAAEGDPVAVECVAWAGRELADLAIGVVRQLEFEAEAFELVLIGSLFRGGPLLTTPLLEAVHAVAPRARAVPLSAPPVVGSVVLAMAKAGLEVRGMNERIATTLAALRGGKHIATDRLAPQEVRQ